MKFWEYGRVSLALIGSLVLGLGVTCCGVYTSGYMYVTGVGLNYNQIAAYKIDHDFGYLTPVTGSPFAANGYPTQELVLGSGRFLAVVNRDSSSVSMYTIGGAGVLYFQGNYPTAGKKPVSIAVDPSGTYLYVADQIAPDHSGRGDITVFQLDPNTAKLTLITNQNSFNTSGKQLPYFEVNYKPIQLVVAAGFVYALDQGYAAGTKGVPGIDPGKAYTPDVFLYQIGSGNGQLVLTQNGPLVLPSKPGKASTMAVSSSSHLYITDTGTNEILPFTISSTGVLQTQVGGPAPNAPSARNPDVVVPASNIPFLYVGNFGPGTSIQQTSSITAFSVDPTTGQLQQISGSPFASGSGPIWMLIDPTNQYIYGINYNDHTITGYKINANNGSLAPLFKNPVSQTVPHPTFAVVTGRTF